MKPAVRSCRRILSWDEGQKAETKIHYQQKTLLTCRELGGARLGTNAAPIPLKLVCTMLLIWARSLWISSIALGLLHVSGSHMASERDQRTFGRTNCSLQKL